MRATTRFRLAAKLTLAKAANVGHGAGTGHGVVHIGAVPGFEALAAGAKFVSKDFGVGLHFAMAGHCRGQNPCADPDRLLAARRNGFGPKFADLPALGADALHARLEGFGDGIAGRILDLHSVWSGPVRPQESVPSAHRPCPIGPQPSMRGTSAGIDFPAREAGPRAGFGKCAAARKRGGDHSHPKLLVHHSVPDVEIRRCPFFTGRSSANVFFFKKKKKKKKKKNQIKKKI
jgi:hypothetical protein